MFRSAILFALLVGAPSSACAAEDEPRRFAPEQLEQDGKVTLSPGFSPDGQTIYFAQSDCTPIWECPQRLKRARRTATGWTTPEDVPLPREGRVDWPTVTPDGKTLLFSWSAKRDEFADLDIYENFDLYALDLTDPDAVPVPLASGDINRPRAGSLKKLRFMHNETLPSLTRAGTLYFMTERPDGIGERDIYVARPGQNGLFETAVPLPAPINTSDRDDGVWVDADERVMLLSYPNRGGEGGAEIFISFKTADGWSEPQNAGARINSSYAEFGARLTPDKTEIVFTSDRPYEGQGAGILQVWSAPFDLSDYQR